MNGCQYLLPKFTLPAGSNKIDNMRWDLAFLSKEEFLQKYPVTSEAYETMSKE